MGAFAADIDNDGDPDLLVTNAFGPTRLFRNRGDGAFEETTAASEPSSAAPPAPARQKSHQPWRGGAHQNTRGFQKLSVPRKVGGG